MNLKIFGKGNLIAPGSRFYLMPERLSKRLY